MLFRTKRRKGWRVITNPKHETIVETPYGSNLVPNPSQNTDVSRRTATAIEYVSIVLNMIVLILECF